MDKRLNKLSAVAIKTAQHEGKDKKLFDGGGLHLHVKSAGKYWRLSYRFGGKMKLLALGVYPEISLSKARELREENRELLSKGIDPAAHRRATKLAQAESAANTFKVLAIEWCDEVHSHKVSKSHAERNLRRLELYAFPYIGSRPIAEITAPEVLAFLRIIEKKGKIETAHRVKTLCGQVFRYGIQTGRAERDVTADLKDALKPAKPKHHAAIIDPKEISVLLNNIDSYDGHFSTCNALKINPILFVRPVELRSMKWEDLNLEKAEWDYKPAKKGLPFIFPLPRQAVEILRLQESVTGTGTYVFPAATSASKPMSNNTINVALKNLGYKDKMTAHGFRAMARTVLAEHLNYPPEIIEQQLAHAVKDANGRAYNRTTFLKQRKEMMQAWADYLDGLRNKVIPINTKQKIAV